MEVAVAKFGDVWFGVVCDGKKIFASAFGNDESEVLDSLRGNVPANAGFEVVADGSACSKNAVTLMQAIYNGEDVSVEASLALDRFPAYTRRVLRAVCRIPVGYVASYGGVASAVGGGARAVGNVMASNAFAPLVPCHRVVTSSLGLGGYGGGLLVKFALLRREKREFTEERDVVVDGGTMQVFPVERVLEKLEAKAPWREL